MECEKYNDFIDDYVYEVEEDTEKEIQDEVMDIILNSIEKQGFTRKKSEAGQKNELINFREKIIRQCCEMTFLERDEAIRILICYKWNMDKISQDWFDNVDENRKKFGIDLAKANSQSKIEYAKEEIRDIFICNVCFSAVENSKIFALKCAHAFCFYCWKRHINLKVNNGLECLHAKCMDQDCNLYIPESVILKFLEGDDININKFEKTVMKNFTEQNSNIKWCPRDCGRYVYSEEWNGKEIECDCSFVYCFKCLRESHYPSTCEMINLWDKEFIDEEKTLTWLNLNSKKCPQCSLSIQKYQGCNIIYCDKHLLGCGCYFCWDCLSNLDTNPYDCKFCSERKNFESIQEKKEVNLEQIKELEKLKKFDYCSDKFMKYKKLQVSVVGKDAELKSRLITLIYDRNFIPNEVKFMADPYSLALKCLRILMNSFVCLYYIKDGSKIGYLECKQIYLERLVADLMSKIADQYKEIITDNKLNEQNISDDDDFFQRFYCYEGKIKKESQLIENFLKKFSEEIDDYRMRIDS